MPFDPDKYLTNKKKAGFDPDSYLSNKTGVAVAEPSQGFNPDSYLSKKNAAPSIKEAGLPENPTDIQAQFEDMLSQKTGRDSVFVGAYTKNPINDNALPKNIFKVPSKAGVLYTTNKKKADKYFKSPTDDVRASVLGYTQSKSKIFSGDIAKNPPKIVTVRDDNSRILFTEATNTPDAVVKKYSDRGYKNVSISDAGQPKDIDFFRKAAETALSPDYVKPPEKTETVTLDIPITVRKKAPLLLKLITGGEEEAQAIMSANAFRMDPEKAKRDFPDDPVIQILDKNPDQSFIPSLWNTKLDGYRVDEIDKLATMSREERKALNQSKGKIKSKEYFKDTKDNREYMLFTVLPFLKNDEFKKSLDRLQTDSYKSPVEKRQDQLIIRDKLLLIEEMQDRGMNLPSTILDAAANMAKYAGEIAAMGGSSATQLGKLGVAASMSAKNVPELANLTVQRMTDKGVLGDKGEFIKTEEGQSLLKALPKSFAEQVATYWTEQQGEYIGKAMKSVGGKAFSKLPKGIASMLKKLAKTKPAQLYKKGYNSLYNLAKKGKLDGFLPEMAEEYIDRIIKPTLMLDDQYRDKDEKYIERVAKSFVPDKRELQIQAILFSVLPLGGHIAGGLQAGNKRLEKGLSDYDKEIGVKTDVAQPKAPVIGDQTLNPATDKQAGVKFTDDEEQAILSQAKNKLAEIENKAKGIPENKTAGLPAQPAQFLTAEEKAERDFLRKNIDDVQKIAESYGIQDPAKMLQDKAMQGDQQALDALNQRNAKLNPVWRGEDIHPDKQAVEKVIPTFEEWQKEKSAFSYGETHEEEYGTLEKQKQAYKFHIEDLARVKGVKAPAGEGEGVIRPEAVEAFKDLSTSEKEALLKQFYKEEQDVGLAYSDTMLRSYKEVKASLTPEELKDFSPILGIIDKRIAKDLAQPPQAQPAGKKVKVGLKQPPAGEGEGVKQGGFTVTPSKSGGTIKIIQGVDSDGEAQEFVLTFDKNGKIRNARVRNPNDKLEGHDVEIGRFFGDPDNNFEGARELTVDDDPSIAIERIGEDSFQAQPTEGRPTPAGEGEDAGDGTGPPLIGDQTLGDDLSVPTTPEADDIQQSSKNSPKYGVVEVKPPVPPASEHDVAKGLNVVDVSQMPDKDFQDKVLTPAQQRIDAINAQIAQNKEDINSGTLEDRDKNAKQIENDHLQKERNQLIDIAGISNKTEKKRASVDKKIERIKARIEKNDVDMESFKTTPKQRDKLSIKNKQLNANIDKLEQSKIDDNAKAIDEIRKRAANATPDNEFVVIDWETQNEVQTGLSREGAQDMANRLNADETSVETKRTRDVLPTEQDIEVLTHRQLLSLVLKKAGQQATKVARQTTKNIIAMGTGASRYIETTLRGLDISKGQFNALMRKLAKIGNSADNLADIILAVEAIKYTNERNKEVKGFNKRKQFVNRASKKRLNEGGIHHRVYDVLSDLLNKYTTLSPKIRASIAKSKKFLDDVRGHPRMRHAAEWLQGQMPESLINRFNQLAFNEGGDRRSMQDVFDKDGNLVEEGLSLDELKELNSLIDRYLHINQTFSNILENQKIRKMKNWLNGLVGNIKLTDKFNPKSNIRRFLPKRGMFKKTLDFAVGIKNYDLYTTAHAIWGRFNPVGKLVRSGRRKQLALTIKYRDQLLKIFRDNGITTDILS